MECSDDVTLPDVQEVLDCLGGEGRGGEGVA